MRFFLKQFVFNAVNLRNLFLYVFSEVYTVYFVLKYFQSHCRCTFSLCCCSACCTYVRQLDIQL